MAAPRLIAGISGATGIAYGIELLRILRELGIKSHLIVTAAGERTRAY
jgi:4-hydroxy-3-polyprenylbenzoate decarboxylase